MGMSPNTRKEVCKCGPNDVCAFGRSTTVPRCTPEDIDRFLRKRNELEMRAIKDSLNRHTQ